MRDMLGQTRMRILGLATYSYYVWILASTVVGESVA